MIACENHKDLWRCGESQYFNGYEAEDPEIDDNGDPIYLRDFFPGAPQLSDIRLSSRGKLLLLLVVVRGDARGDATHGLRVKTKKLRQVHVHLDAVQCTSNAVEMPDMI